MAQDRHAEKFQNDKFCARVPCDHSDYIKCCKPGWSDWTFAQKKKGGAGQKKYEAHHLLCWSCVIKAFFTDEAAKAILKGTDWCVNRKPNMIALPLWGHTVKWYVDNDGPPKFANLPQHDWDHNCTLGYTSEVNERLKEFAKDLKDAKKAHELPEPKDIAGSLTSTSGKFRTQLKARGIRAGGTHASFLDGGEMAGWYLPFSMANAGVATKRRAPTSFKEKKKQKLAAIKAAQALARGG
jgi:hypothetical protein